MRISIGVHETNSLEELSSEGLDEAYGEAGVVIALDDIVQ